MRPRLTDGETLVRAAATCFAEKGIRATTVDDVAAAAGVSRPTVYRHAGGKDDLIRGVIIEEARALVAELRGSVADATDLHSMVSALVAAALQAIHDRPVLNRASRADLREVLPDITLDAAPLIENIVATLREVVAERPDLVPDTDLDEILEDIVRYVIGRVHTPTLDGSGDDPIAAGERAARIFGPALEGLSRKGESRRRPAPGR